MGTEDKDARQTDDKSATDKKSKSAATPDAEDQVVLSAKDYKNLISQRDKNFDEAKKTGGDLDEVTNWALQKQEEEAKEGVVKNFLTENKDKYPNVKEEDLMIATSPEDIEAIAKRVQRIHEDAEQSALEKIQAGEDTSLSDEEITKAEKALKKDDQSKDKFGQMVNLRLRRKR